MFTPDELKAVPLFQPLNDQQRARLAGLAADQFVLKDEWLIQEGENPWFFVLFSGSLDVYKEMNGKRLVVHKYGPGEFFGELPILLNAPSVAGLRAREASRVMRLDRLSFKEIIDGSPAAAAMIFQAMTDRVIRIQEYVRDSPAARVLVVGSRYDTDCRDIRSFLTANRIMYKWIDRERDKGMIPMCLETCGVGDGPVVIIDKVHCVENPTIRNVAEALGIQTKPNHERYDVAVIGAGPAGLGAAVYGSSEGLKVLLIEKQQAGGQAGTSTRIENYLGFHGGISGDELTDRAVKQAARFGTEIVLTREVTDIFRLPDGSYCVELNGGDRVTSRTVVLATGVSWRRLDCENVDRLLGRGVLYGAARTEAQTVIGKDIYIVGGGNSAGQAAMFFSSYANSVTILVRGAGLKLTMSTYLIDQLASRCNVSIEPFTEVVSVGGDNCLDTICTITKGDSAPKDRPADALFIMIGADANTDWLPKELQRDERGYVCTGRDIPGWDQGKRAPFLLETNLPGFFCAGDVRHDSIKRVSSGVGEGSMAIAFVHQYLALKDQSTLLAHA